MVNVYIFDQDHLQLPVSQLKVNFQYYIFSNVGGVPLDFETKDFLGRSRDQFVMSINIRSFVL